MRRYVLALPKGTIVVSGGARGVDRTAELAANDAGLFCEIYFAEWKKYGKAAGFIRNERVVQVADRIVAFWDGKSRGTMHTVELAKAAGKPVQLIICRRAPRRRMVA